MYSPVPTFSHPPLPLSYLVWSFHSVQSVRSVCINIMQDCPRGTPACPELQTRYTPTSIPNEPKVDPSILPDHGISPGLSALRQYLDPDLKTGIFPDALGGSPWQHAIHQSSESDGSSGITPRSKPCTHTDTLGPSK